MNGFGDELITHYADKIYGFAYSKTRNHYDAEDLSQEIILQLCGKDFSAIENMDAYIWRISMYTWSNYVRKNEKQWRALDNASALEFLASDENVEEDFIQSELYEKLRREVMYLGEARRKITVMFYYDNLSGDEIAVKLGIPPSTVRWHIRKIKDTLKERLVMTKQSEIFEPIKMNVGHSGWCPSMDMHGLGSDSIIQNICWVCRSKAKTVEEIGREIGVAAVYVEEKLPPLCELDYIRQVGANKYITNFLIRDTEFTFECSRWKTDFIYPTAKMAYDLVKGNLSKIRETTPIHGEFSDNELISALLVPEIGRVSAVLTQMLMKKTGVDLSCETPKRSDGSQHWVQANKEDDDEEIERIRAIDSECAEMIDNSMNALKTRWIDGMESIQMDLHRFVNWRWFDGPELKQLKRMHDLSEAGLLPDERDMDAVANLSAKGYIRVDDGKPVILVPYIAKTGAKPDAGDIIGKYEKLLAEKLDLDAMAEKLTAALARVKKLIPAHLDEGVKNHHLAECLGLGEGAMMYSLYKHGDLAMPTDEQKKRMLTLVWEK